VHGGPGVKIQKYTLLINPLSTVHLALSTKKKVPGELMVAPESYEYYALYNEKTSKRYKYIKLLNDRIKTTKLPNTTRHPNS